MLGIAIPNIYVGDSYPQHCMLGIMPPNQKKCPKMAFLPIFVNLLYSYTVFWSKMVKGKRDEKGGKTSPLGPQDTPLSFY